MSKREEDLGEDHSNDKAYGPAVKVTHPDALVDEDVPAEEAETRDTVREADGGGVPDDEAAQESEDEDKQLLLTVSCSFKSRVFLGVASRRYGSCLIQVLSLIFD